MNRSAIGRAGIAIVFIVVVVGLLIGVFIGIHYNIGGSNNSTTCANSVVIYPLGKIQFYPQNATNDQKPNLPIMYYNSSVSGYPDGITYAFAPFSTLTIGTITGELTTNRNVDFFLYNNGVSGNAAQIVLNKDFATDVKLDLSLNESNYTFLFLLQHDYSLDSPQPLVVDVTQTIAECHY